MCSAAVLATPAHSQVAISTELANKVVPIEVFGQFPTIERPLISPDGTIVAAKIRSGGVQVLALVPLSGGGKPRIIARDDEVAKDKIGVRRVVGWQWINADILLISLASRDFEFGAWFDNTRVVAYNVKTSKLTPLGWDKAGILGGNVLWKTPPGDPKPRILLERHNNTAQSFEQMFQPEVIDVDVNTGSYTTVVRPNIVVDSWEADGAGVVRLGSSSDRDTGKLRILYRPDATSQFRTIMLERMDMHTTPVLPSYILAGSNKAYALANNEGYRALYEYDLTTMKPGKKVFGVDGYDLDGVSLTPDGTAIQAYHYTTQRSHTRYLDSRLNQIQSVLEESFGAGNVAINSADAKREKIVFTVSAMGQAPTIFVFDTETGNTTRLAYFNETLKNAKLNPVKVIRYQASDGKSIEAIVTTPRHRTGKGLPLIILPHGGPWARDDADWDAYQWAQAIAEKGYVVIQPNYRGSTGYGKEFGKAVDGNWGLRMQDDLNDAIGWLAKDGTIDPKRVCMVGWSYGGYAASRAAQRDGDKYRCAISGAGVHDLPAMVAYDKGYLGVYGAKAGLGAAGDLKAISPSLHAADYSIPILIVHGAKDQRVPVAQSRNLVARLKAAGKKEGKDFVYIEQPLNTHNLLREEDRIQFLREAEKFLDAHNPAYLPSDTDKPPAK
jgi:dipeptidyl aminopeptidase/acylaminoacyl peptidase